MLSLNASGFACSFDERNIENLRHDLGGKKEFGNNRSRKGTFYNVLSCLHHWEPIRTFWTFTVPELQENFPITDREISKKFGVLLNGLSKRYARKQANGLKNYVWVSEAQERGNIHFHLVTSTKFIEVKFVQDWWNKLLNQDSKNFPIVEKMSVNPYELLRIFPDMQEKKVTKEITSDISVDYYFFDSKTVYEFMMEKEKERERMADALGLSKSTQV